MKLPRSRNDVSILRGCVGLVNSYRTVSNELGERMRGEMRSVFTVEGCSGLIDWFYNRDTEFYDIFDEDGVRAE